MPADKIEIEKRLWDAADEFRETKHLHRDFNLEDKSYWYPYGRD